MTTQDTWTAPNGDALFAALEATWPAAALTQQGGWTIRDGQGGGSRVSAATGQGDVALAEAAMKALGQNPLFMIRPGDEALDAELASRGYLLADPVIVYAASAKDLGKAEIPELAGIPSDRPLAIQKEIWAEGGINAARLAVMRRASDPKSYLIARHKGQPAGTAFVAAHNDIAMLHALEIASAFRRQGVGAGATIAAARWAVAQNATTFAVLCTRENTGANKLYQALGMQPATHYHYRKAP